MNKPSIEPIAKYKSYAEQEKEYADKKIHPAELKNAVAEKLITILEPARKHFEQPEPRKMLEELEGLMVTR